MTAAEYAVARQLDARRRVAELAEREPDKRVWITLYVPDKRTLAQRIAQVTGVAVWPGGRGRMQFCGKPADLVELLDVFVDEVIEFR